MNQLINNVIIQFLTEVQASGVFIVYCDNTVSYGSKLSDRNVIIHVLYMYQEFVF